MPATWCGTLKLVDTNVLVCALGREHPLRAACRRVLAWGAANQGELTTDAEALQELLHFYGTRGEAGKGAAAVRECLAILPGPLAIAAAEVQEAAALVLASPRLSTRDAIHAAVVRLHGPDAIISADRDFDEVPGLRRLSPEVAVP